MVSSTVIYTLRNNATRIRHIAITIILFWFLPTCPVSGSNQIDLILFTVIDFQGRKFEEADPFIQQ